MKRENKFRGKDLIHKKWIYGGIAIDGKGNTVILPNENWHKGGTVNYETVCQYTGLKDSKDKEIYEGDIIKAPSGRLYEVVFDTFKLEVNRTKEKVVDVYKIDGWCIKYHGAIDCLDDEVLHGVVIGNIFDNKGLLNE